MINRQENQSIGRPEVTQTTLGCRDCRAGQGTVFKLALLLKVNLEISVLGKGWRDGPVGKSTYGSRSSISGGSQPLVNPVPVDLAPSSGLWAGTYVVQMNVHRHTHAHKTFFKENHKRM